MYVEELFTKNHDHDVDHMISTIKKECSQFITESRSNPLFKNLPISYNDFHKVKVRFKKKHDSLTDIYNNAFQGVHLLLRERSIFSNGELSFIIESGDREPFYIFPSNGYQYLYNPEVESSKEHNITFNKLIHLFNDEKKALDTVSELLHFTYKSNNLHEGISSGAEILFFDIPNYYAIRQSRFTSYSEILTFLKK